MVFRDDSICCQNFTIGQPKTRNWIILNIDGVVSLGFGRATARGVA